MKFRPRYSLLTLLLLTALVAGGVKLWYGPHHFVERDGWFEEEYTYTRSWDASRIIHGPHLYRSYLPDGKTLEIVLHYYREGKRLPWEYHLTIADPSEVYPGIPRISFLRNYQMSAEEQLACRQIIELEYRRFKAQGTEAYDILREAVSESSYRQIYLE